MSNSTDSPLSPEEMAHRWTFLSNHAHVLLSVARDPHARVRDIAKQVGITERAVQRILGELVQGGALDRERHGRRNHYDVQLDLPLRHPLESDHTVGDLLRALGVEVEHSRPAFEAGEEEENGDVTEDDTEITSSGDADAA